MKKLLFIASTIMLLGGVVHAQELFLPEASIVAGVDIEGTFPHFNSTVTSGSQATTASHFRLIGKVYAKHNNSEFVTLDSITYKYGYGRGGDVTAEAPNDDRNILFDESNTYEYNAATKTFVNKLKRTQLFDNNDRITNLTYSVWKNHLSNYTDSARYLYGYSADGKMTSSVSQVWFGTIWANSVSSSLVYNSNNNITKMHSKLYEIEFVYGTNNKITQTIDKEVKNGKLTYSERKTYTYGTNGDVSTYVLEKWDDISKYWVNTNKWEYNNTGTPNVEEEVMYTWNGTGWLKSTRNYFYYDAARNDILVEKKMQRYSNSQNMFINVRTEIWAYNANNQPTVMTSKTWDATSNSFISTTGDEQVRFLYEYYNPTSINNISLSSNISTYPTPAGSQVNVAVKWDKPQAFDLALVDMTGKVLLNRHVDATIDYTTSISVASLPSGNYFVKLSNSNIQLTERVVVAH
ncbi:MAG: T9SS type A sorting domain-containing protein [Flavipsychrobacter sp.]